MTVKELKSLLANVPDDAPVVTWCAYYDAETTDVVVSRTKDGRVWICDNAIGDEISDAA